MNKQEAIEYIKKISDGLLEVKFVSLESVIDIVSQSTLKFCTFIVYLPYNYPYLGEIHQFSYP